MQIYKPFIFNKDNFLLLIHIYSIGLFDLLTLYQLEDGRFAVNRYTTNARQSNGDFFHVEGKIYENAREAVKTFELWRRKYELGFDFETVKENL